MIVPLRYNWDKNNMDKQPFITHEQPSEDLVITFQNLNCSLKLIKNINMLDKFPEINYYFVRMFNYSIPRYKLTRHLLAL